MSSFGTLYTYLPNARILKILAAASLNSLSIEIPKPPTFKMGVTNQTPEFLSLFPLGKVPALALPTGTSIFESDAIAQFVAESGPASSQLVGGNRVERAAIRQWICFAEGEIMVHVVELVSWRWGMVPYDEEREGMALRALERALGVLESVLGGGCGWLVEGAGGKLSLADLSVAGALVWGFEHVVDGEMRGRFPGTVEWYLRVVGDDSVKEVFGEPGMIDVRKSGGPV